MSKEPTKPSESLVQELLAERRELKVAVERLRLELEEARGSSSGPDPKLNELQTEVERLRYQLASARADAGHLRDERDELRLGVERAIEQMARPGQVPDKK
jgi:chromosome segregation ATPase